LDFGSILKAGVEFVGVILDAKLEAFAFIFPLPSAPEPIVMKIHCHFNSGNIFFRIYVKSIWLKCSWVKKWWGGYPKCNLIWKDYTIWQKTLSEGVSYEKTLFEYPVGITDSPPEDV